MLEFINKAIALIPEASPMLIAAVAFIFDMVLRLAKTAKPLSVAHAVASGAKGLAQLFQKLADFLDRVLPQRVQE